MKIEHVALWTKNLERMKEFYEHYFNATSNSLYHNQKKQFRSYFLTFESGTRLELMHRPEIETSQNSEGVETFGYAHLALAVGSESEVNRLTQILNKDGYPILDGPRRTGDGYYESVIADPDGNRIELTI